MVMLYVALDRMKREEKLYDIFTYPLHGYLIAMYRMPTYAIDVCVEFLYAFIAARFVAHGVQVFCINIATPEGFVAGNHLTPRTI